MSDQSPNEPLEYLTDAALDYLADLYATTRRDGSPRLNGGDRDVTALVAEVRKRRAADERVRAVLAEWDTTEPEDGWGRMAEEIAAALGGTK